ncbi:hypothetical protein MKW92_046369 [Papaver armeniacum]|nr:hypothetical protein MKW92_046369 [Papaver armeniacum]
MGVVVLVFLCVLVTQLLNPCVNGWTKDCIASKFTYSRSSDQQEDLFYINGNKVEKKSFCKALEYCYQTVILFDSISEEELGGGGGAGRKHCDFEISLGGLPQRVGRKVLLGLTRDISAANQADQKKTSAKKSTVEILC